MELGKHLGKGLWAFAGKGLPALFGLAIIFLVVRHLPHEEFGAFTIIQTFYTLILVLGYALAFQPLTKFAAESNDATPYVVASLTIGSVFFFVGSILIVAFRLQLGAAFDPEGKTHLETLFFYVPLLFFAGFYRNFAISFLQARYHVEKIFWIDTLYFVGTPLGLQIAQTLGRLEKTSDVLNVMVVCLLLSTILALIFTRKILPHTLYFDRWAFSQMWRYGRYTFGGAATYSLYSQMDVLFVSSYAGLVAVATYNAAKILTRLFEMVAQVLQMFLVPFSSRASAKGEIDNIRVIAEKSICFSTVFLLPVSLAMLLVPETILHFLYNGKYDNGALILRVLGLLGLAIPWNAAIVSILAGIDKIKQSFYFNIGLLALSGIGYFLLTPLLGAYGTSIAMVGSFTVITVMLVAFVQHLIPLRFLNVVRRASDMQKYLSTRIAATARLIQEMKIKIMGGR